MNEKNRRRQFFANQMHREIFWLVSLATLLPVFITTIALYHLILNIMADQIGFPEAIASNIIPAAQRVYVILMTVLPFAIMVILFFAHQIAHRIVGPFDRIVRELGECLNGTRQGPIVIRKSDKFQPLVDKINLFLEKNKS